MHASMASTGNAPITGICVSQNVDPHWSACFALFHPVRFASMYPSAHCSKVRLRAALIDVASLAALRASIGSTLSRRPWRAWRARSRAAEKTYGRQRTETQITKRPKRRYRNIDDRLTPSPPFSSLTDKYSPPPSQRIRPARP